MSTITTIITYRSYLIAFFIHRLKKAYFITFIWARALLFCSPRGHPDLPVHIFYSLLSRSALSALCSAFLSLSFLLRIILLTINYPLLQTASRYLVLYSRYGHFYLTISFLCSRSPPRASRRTVTRSRPGQRSTSRTRTSRRGTLKTYTNTTLPTRPELPAGGS